MPKKKKVSYMVGVNLDGPVVVNHDVFIEDENIKQQSAPPKKQQPQKATISTKKVDTKRTRGQSQKSVRMDHKK